LRAELDGAAVLVPVGHRPRLSMDCLGRA
jgi:hypothetical protein